MPAQLQKTPEDVAASEKYDDGNPGQHYLLEYIEPPNKLSDKISYRELGPGAVHPVEKAERQVEYLSMDFAEWLTNDIENLQQRWRDLKSDAEKEEMFTQFNRAVHNVKGGAGMLKYEDAGALAAALSCLTERTQDIDIYLAAIDLMVQAICVSATGSHAGSLGEENIIDELCDGFSLIIKSELVQTA